MKKSIWTVLAVVVVLAAFAFSRRGAIEVHRPGPSSPSTPDFPGRREAPPLSPNAATVAGAAKLLRGGEPMPGAVIDLRRTSGRTYRAIADESGRYAFGELEPGFYELEARVSDRGRPFRLTTFELKPAERMTVDAVFPLGPCISGRVLTWDRRPPANLEVTLEHAVENDQSESGRFPLQSEGRFRYVVERLRGKISIAIRADGYLPSAPMALDVGDRNITGLEFTLAGGGSQGGVVLNVRAEPVPKATVQLTPDSFPAVAVQRAVTDEQGRFDFPALPEGGYTTSVVATGYVVEQQKEPIRILSGQRNAPLSLLLREGWKITGRVVDSADRPVAKATVEVKEGPKTTRTQSKPDGTFVLAGIHPAEPEHQMEPGIDSLLCEAKGYPRLRLRNIPPGSDLKLVLLTPGSIQVSVSFAGGSVPGGQSWSVWLKSLKSVDDATHLPIKPTWDATPCTGQSAQIGGLAPGNYEFSLRAPGHEPFVVPEIWIRSGETLRIDAVLTPGGGEGDAGVASLSLNNSADLRRQIQVLIKDMSPADRQSLFERLTTHAKSLPEKSEKRTMLEDALRELAPEKK